MTFINNASSNILDETTLTTTHTSAQSVSTTRAIITGSDIQYTPTANSTHVLYQCAFQYISNPDADTHLFVSLVNKTNIGDAWSYVADKSFAISVVDSAQSCSFENIEILVPTWSGSKYLALYIRSALSSTETSLHQLKMDDSGYNTGNENFVDTLTSCSSLRSGT
mgnify:CR=1 FL=1